MGTIRQLFLLLPVLVFACADSKTTDGSSDKGPSPEIPAPFTIEINVDQPFFGCRPIRFTVTPINAVLPIRYTYSLDDLVIPDAPKADLIPFETPAGTHILTVAGTDGLNRLTQTTTSFYLYEPYMCEPPGSECNNRCDCREEGTICSAGRCVQATGPCMRDDQCPLGSICDFSRTCIPGCMAQCDCKGSEICNASTLQCEICSRTNPCPAGSACSADGVCEAATSCANTSECSGGQVCMNGVCGFCSTHADCSADGSRRCAANGFCAETSCNDTDCQATLQNQDAFCNLDTDACDVPTCTRDGDCGLEEVCDKTVHHCRPWLCSDGCNERYCASLGGFCGSTSCGCLAQ